MQAMPVGEQVEVGRGGSALGWAAHPTQLDCMTTVLLQVPANPGFFVGFISSLLTSWRIGAPAS